MSSGKVLAMVMAGGEGKRLYPLTAEQSKPAVPFGGRYRIVDFVLSNLINSEIHSIYLLVQYQSQSLIEHIRKAWVMPPITPSYFVTVVPPQMRRGAEWFRGTADAVYQNLNLIEEHRPDLVAVFGADHIYRMELRQMLAFHESNDADVTIATLPVPVDNCRAFGIVEVDRFNRITAFSEKPESAPPIPGNPSLCFASMGNYIFDREVLIRVLEDAHRKKLDDFGTHVLPQMLDTHRVLAYDYADNQVPGVKPYEEPSYWRDVGTVDTYFQTHQDLLGLRPRFDVFNPEWPVYSGNYLGPVTNIVGGTINNSIIGEGSVINHGKVRNCVLRREVFVDEDAELESCIIMDYAVIGRGANLRNAIVDRHNIIRAGTRIGWDRDRDKQRYFITESGVVVVPAGSKGTTWIYDAG